MNLIHSGYKIKTALWTLLILFSLSSAGQAAPDSVYGCYWNADGLANLEIGKSHGRKVAYRFRAEYTGIVDKARIFFVYRSGYAKGDGGEVRVDFKTDDGTSNHYPSGQVLSSYVVRDPMSENFPLLHFNPPVSVEKGKLYHLEFSNVASDPINHYVSIDDLYNESRNAAMQPAVSDVDLAVIWKPSSSSSWSVNYGHSPIYNLFYTHGEAQGNGYMDAYSVSGRRTISGSQKVRSSFTVSCEDMSVTQVSVRVRKVNASGGLTIRLETADGELIEEGTIAAASIGSSMNWVTYRFSRSHTLANGRSYHLVCTSPGGSYTTFGLQQGTGYGFDGATVFNDGNMQYTTGGSWQADKGGSSDMQLYFSLSASETTSPPKPPKNLRIVSYN